MNILIVGAGPTGLTAAIELRRRGFAPRLIDRKDAPSPLSRAVGINARTLDLLEASGAGKALLAQGYRLGGFDIHGRDGRVVGAVRAARLPHRYNFILALPQDRTETVMRDVLSGLGGRVEYGVKLAGLALKEAKACATLESGGETREEIYDLVIGADGIRSLVRESCGISFDGFDYPNRWSIADFDCAALPWPKDRAHMFLRGGKLGLIVRIGENRFRAVSDTEDALAEIPGIASKIDRVLHADTFRISVRQAASYQSGCVYLAGDAAHVHSPAGGRGMNLGIEDACDLARRIAEGGLDGYTAARHPVGRKALRLSEFLTRAVTAANPALVAVRRIVLAFLTAFPALQKPLLMRVAGLK